MFSINAGTKISAPRGKLTEVKFTWDPEENADFTVGIGNTTYALARVTELTDTSATVALTGVKAGTTTLTATLGDQVIARLVLVT